MKPWRWKWRRDEHAHARADAALRRSDAQLEHARRRDAEGERLADRIRQMREHNHLAEAVARALREGR